MQLSHYLKIYPYKEEPGYFLVFSAKAASTVLLHESALKSIEEGTLSEADADTLAGIGLLVPSRHEEKCDMLHFIERCNAGVKQFSAMVIMNLDCNLACTYCYEGKMKGRRYMSRETADLIIDFIKTHHISHDEPVHLDFYGGEPLLSTELIKHISEKLKASAEKRRLGYSFNLITNGTLLTRRRTEELAALGLKGTKITLDGSKELHNRTRPFKSGAGSFDTIIKNIKDVCGIIKIQIGGNYTQENYREFPRLLDSLIKEGLTPEKISMVKFTPITNTKSEFAPPEFSGGCASINEPWLFEASIFLREETLKRGFHTQKLMPSACMIEAPNDLVISFEGTFYKCPAFLGWEGLEVGDLRKGIKDYRESHGLDLWKKQECLDCAYLPLCFGGCRYMKLLRDGNINDVDCKKPYLDATLEAFISQDIRYKLKADGT